MFTEEVGACVTSRRRSRGIHGVTERRHTVRLEWASVDQVSRTTFMVYAVPLVAVWRSGNALVSIDAVALQHW